MVSPPPFTVLITTELVICHAPRARSLKVEGTDLPPQVLRQPGHMCPKNQPAEQHRPLTRGES